MGVRRALARGAEAVGNRVMISGIGGLLGMAGGAVYGSWPDRYVPSDYYRTGTEAEVRRDNDTLNAEVLDDILGGALIGASLPHLSQRFARGLIEDLAGSDARFQAKVMTEVARARAARGLDEEVVPRGYGGRTRIYENGEDGAGGGFGSWMEERADLADELIADQRAMDEIAPSPHMVDLIDEARDGTYMRNSAKRLRDWSLGGPHEDVPLLAVPVAAVASSGVMGALEKRKRKTSSRA